MKNFQVSLVYLLVKLGVNDKGREEEGEERKKNQEKVGVFSFFNGLSPDIILFHGVGEF